MSCSTLPFGHLVDADTSLRMALSWSFVLSPASKRRLQRTIEGGMGFAARHAPFANS